MCRNIRTLFNFEPPVTEEEIRASALQFVRKLSGFAKPSKFNPIRTVFRARNSFNYRIGCGRASAAWWAPTRRKFRSPTAPHKA